MLSRTGRQFYCVDDDMWSPHAQEGKPVIAVMADKDSIFFKALSLFPHMTIYGNAVHDLTVTYCTALIEPHDPFTELSAKNNRLAVKLDPEYKHVIESFFRVPEGEVVPIHELEKVRRAERAAIAWYKPSKYGAARPLVPPFLKLPFPLNILFYMVTPLLIPMGLTYAVFRFRRESAESRKRLAELTTSEEADSSLGALMRKMEMAAARVMDADEAIADDGWEVASDLEEGTQESTKKRKSTRADTPEGDKRVELERGAASLPSPVATPGSRTPAEIPDPMTTTKSESYPQLALRKTPDPSDPAQPALTEAQLEMIESLNSIPQLKKVRAFFPFARNAHSMIIARDSEKFSFNQAGFEVVRHWADRFVL
ncbi:serine esterase [Ceratobasidium sp. AG-Ba]|nr:serine esterase [Ceratobasidium sp. AG-Ba]